MPDCSKVFQSRPSGCEPYMIADDIHGIVTSELRTETLGSNATGAGLTELDDAFSTFSTSAAAASAPPTLPPTAAPTGAASKPPLPPPAKDDVDIVVEDALVQNGALDPIVPDAEAVRKAAAKVVDVAKTTPLVVKEASGGSGSKAALPFQQMAGKCYATSVRKAGKDVEFGVTMCPLREDGSCPTSRSDPSCVSVVAKISMHDIQPATFVKSA